MASTLMVFANHSTLALRPEHRYVLFRISFAEHCVLALLSSFTSALVGSPVQYFHVFASAKAFAESGSLLFSPAVLHAFVADVRIFSILQNSQFDFKKAYFACHRSREVE